MRVVTDLNIRKGIFYKRMPGEKIVVTHASDGVSGLIYSDFDRSVHKYLQNDFLVPILGYMKDCKEQDSDSGVDSSGESSSDEGGDYQELQKAYDKIQEFASSINNSSSGKVKNYGESEYIFPDYAVFTAVEGDFSYNRGILIELREFLNQIAKKQSFRYHEQFLELYERLDDYIVGVYLQS